MRELRSLDYSTSKRVLNLLKTFKLTVGKIVVKRVTIVELRVNNGGGNGTGRFGVKVRAYGTKLPDVIVTGFRE